MLTATPVLVMIIAGVLAFLAVVQAFLAVRHDHAVSIQGPLEEERAIFARIAEKRATLADLENDLQKRREALAVVNDLQVEVDALLRKRADLLDEWNQMGDRRQEVLALRRELEEVQIEKLRLEAEVAAGRAEHEEIRDRIARAQRLLDQVETLKKDHDALVHRIEELRPELRRLEEAQQRVEEAQKRVDLLDSRARALETESARLEGLIAAGQHRADELEARIASARDALGGVEEARTRALSELAAAEVALRGVEAEGREAGDRMRQLQAARDRMAADHDATRLALTEAQDLLADLKSRCDDLERDRMQLVTERSGALASLEELRRQIAGLEETRAMLEARNARLSKPIGEADSTAGDQLQELKTEPQVITALRGWAVRAEDEDQDENRALHLVQLHFRATGLTYPDRTLRAFHTAMKVNDTTQMAVLAGISGTGKSQLPRQYAAGMGIGFLQVPVQPRWDSPQDLMGFYNYVEGRFRPTDMARALWAMDEVNNPDALKDRMLMILLDEMNLARVEYYFSDFLSRLESRPSRAEVGNRDRRKDAEIELEIPMPDGRNPRIFPGYNLLFAGTMNEDESTQSLSDKVVDRANVIRFAAPRKIVRDAAVDQRPETRALTRSVWERWSRPRRSEAERNLAQERIGKMVDLMRDLGRPFGHRLGRAMLAYVDLYPVTEGVPDIVNRALADQVEMRLLPKLRGVEVEVREQELGKLRSFVAQLGDDQLEDAIRQSIDAASATGQFVWQGVTRS